MHDAEEERNGHHGPAGGREQLGHGFAAASHAEAEKQRLRFQRVPEQLGTDGGIGFVDDALGDGQLEIGQRHNAVANPEVLVFEDVGAADLAPVVHGEPGLLKRLAIGDPWQPRGDGRNGKLIHGAASPKAVVESSDGLDVLLGVFANSDSHEGFRRQIASGPAGTVRNNFCIRSWTSSEMFSRYLALSKP